MDEMANTMAPASVIGPGTLAELAWPAGAGRGAKVMRGAALAFLGACILTLSAKVNVPGPVPMTLQTLAVMALGATLGFRLSVAAVALYIVQGALGLPVFANTPPLAAGLPYLMGPTGGFLLGFAVAAGLVGYAADRGLMRRPVLFGLVLAAANVALLAIGCVWLALLANVGSGSGIGFARAFAVGVQPFLIGNAIKLLLAAIALPLVFDLMHRALGRTRA
jgi:biotin transport system substrate-specific component